MKFKTRMFWLLLSLIPIEVFAEARLQKDLRFPVAIEELFKGDVHFAVEVLKPSTLEKKYPELHEMDTLELLRQKDIFVLVGKSVQVLKKPAGFFDNRTLSDEKFIRHVLGEQTVTKVSENTFKVKVPGGGPTYRLRTFFDSDDISTLPNSRVIRAVTQAKKLDVISQGSSSTQVREFYNFSAGVLGGMNVSSFIPLKEEKTLMLTYTLVVMKRPLKNKKGLKQNFLDESLSTKDLIDSYR